MIPISINAACAYVRRALDELVSIQEIEMLASSDAMDLHKLVEGAIVEAAVKVHSTAPSLMIDGITGEFGVDYSVEHKKDGIAEITMLKDTVRIESIKNSDSNIVVCDLIPEDSAEGRKQLNPYTRGTYDDPCVVLLKNWAEDYKPIVKYFSTISDENYFTIKYVPYPIIENSAINICSKLEYAILNEIVAMVLDCINEREKAALYREKSIKYQEGK